MSGDFDDDPLGYGRPPSWGRFRKGQSGNPKGRPRKKRPETRVEPTGQSAIDDMLRAELAREIGVVEGGASRKMRMIEVAVRARLTAAARGSPIVGRDVLRQARELEERDARRVEAAAAKKRETYELIERWKRSLEKDWVRAAETGIPPEREFPHPDDILLYPRTLTWCLRGPFFAEDLPRFRYYEAQRDLLFARAALDRRTRNRRGNTSTIWDIWVYFDVMLPLKWQISNDDCIRLLWFFDRMLLRELRLRVAFYQDRLDKMAEPYIDREVRRESGRFANRLMQPILKAKGYRSLAEFERAWEIHRENMPWPKMRR